MPPHLLHSIGAGPLTPLSAGTIALPPHTPIRFDIASGGCWYGHGFAHRQPYPLNAEAVVNTAFAVNNARSPIWLCSAGYAILAETAASLCVRFNERGSGVFELSCGEPLSLRIFREASLPAAHRALMAHLGWPGPLPMPMSAEAAGDCVFCTWTQFPRCIDQERVLAMAREIRRRGYPCSFFIIDDRWETAFGELAFSRDFPDPRAMVDALHALGFRVLLWVTPFVNREAATFAPLAARKILVPDADGPGPALLTWWGGTAGLVDLTNPAGRDWFRDQLRRLRAEAGVDGFKVDGGDAKYQPPLAKSAWHSYRGPSGYADELLAVAEEVAPGACETRTVWLSQRRNIIWRQGGKDSHWGIDNGLRAMVNLALHMGLMGYDILMPDMIPGRVQTMVSDFPLPTDELMVRWTEATAFMPLMQFSYFPWNYSAATESAVRGYALAHKAIGGYLLRQAECRTAPLIRPMWYDWPEVAEFYSISDQWLLGSDLLAAPALAENQVARDVSLPPGRWLDAWTGRAFDQPRIVQHPAPCPGIPLFVRETNRELFAALHDALVAIERGTIVSGQTTATYRAGLDRDLSVTG